MAAVQRPIAVACIQEPAPAPAWRTKPSWYLLADEDRIISPKTQRFLAERIGANIRWQHVDHTPMYTEPEIIVGVILDAGRKTLVRDGAAQPA